MRAIVIEPMKAPEVRDVDSIGETVGGWLEALPFAGGSVYINEEGQLLDLPINGIATAIYNMLSGRNLYGDQLRGTMVLLGPIDSNGDDTPIADAMIDRVNEALSQIMRDT